MGKTITATEAVRKFSEILNVIKYRGNHYTILRGKKAITFISPAEEHLKERTLGELRGLLAKLPHLGDEAEYFEKDMKEIIKHQSAMPEKSKWA